MSSKRLIPNGRDVVPWCRGRDVLVDASELPHKIFMEVAVTGVVGPLNLAWIRPAPQLKEEEGIHACHFYKIQENGLPILGHSPQDSVSSGMLVKKVHAAHCNHGCKPAAVFEPQCAGRSPWCGELHVHLHGLG